MRGAHLEAENQTAAFRRALACGCDGLELDLHLTADRQWVVHHDAVLTKGTVIAAERFRDLKRVAPGLVRLPEVLEAFAAGCWLDLEVKCEELSGLTSLLRRYAPRGVVSSFEPGVLQSLERQHCPLPLCLNLRRPLSPRRIRRVPVTWVAPHVQLARRWYLRQLRDGGWRTLVWTVNRPGRIRQLLRAGADALVSDDPDLLQRTAEAWRREVDD